MRHIRFAILLCEDLLVQSSPSVVVNNDNTEIYRQFLTASLANITSDVTFALDAYPVHKMHYPPNNTHYDAILISATRRASVTDPSPWIQTLIAYVNRTLNEEPSIKLYGVCYGHQLIAMALGGQVEFGEWEISVVNTSLTPIGQAIFGTRALSLHQSHRQQVTQIPAHAHIIASSNATRNHGMVIFDPTSLPLPANIDTGALSIDLTSIQVLTFQGHPEITEPIMRTMIAQADEFSQDMIEDALLRVGLPTDGIDTVGRVWWGILGVTSDTNS